jgi:hypothetical protein
VVFVSLLAVPLFAGEGRVQDATAYAAQYGVSVDEGARRLELQGLVSDLEGELTEKEAATFAGLWIQHKPEYRVVVRFTDRAAEARLKARVAGGPLEKVIETRNAKWSLAELESRQLDVRGQAKKAQTRLESDINVVENKLEVYTLEPEKLHGRLAAAGARLPEGVEVKRINQHSGTDELLGGSGMYGCSAGFGVRASNGELGMSTAGHCPNDQYYQGIWLPFRAEKYSGDQDVQWNSTCDRVQVSNRINTGIGTRGITSTRSRTNQTVGTYLCKYGMSTGRTCGTISSKSYDIGSGFNGTFIRVDGYALRAGGDSGGPWFVEDVAYGIHHGYPGSDPNDAIYMAINYISAIGVGVLTYDPGPGCNLAPQAALVADQDTPGHYNFDASYSSDPDGYIVNYHFDFGDGMTQSGPDPYAEHWYSDGSYVVTLTVTDNEGASTQAVQFVSVCTQSGSPYELCPIR